MKRLKDPKRYYDNDGSVVYISPLDWEETKLRISKNDLNFGRLGDFPTVKNKMVYWDLFYRLLQVVRDAEKIQNI